MLVLTCKENKLANEITQMGLLAFKFYFCFYELVFTYCMQMKGVCDDFFDIIFAFG
jgi:hypothetical protein